MTNKEFHKLYAYWKAKRNAPPRPLLLGKRQAKGRAKHVGMVLKTSRVIPVVGLDTQLRQHVPVRMR